MIDKLLIKWNACQDARIWAQGKSWQEIYKTCERGDWLLWLFIRTNPRNKRLWTLAAGQCANTFRHLMDDPRSIAAVDAAIAYGKGKIGIVALQKMRIAAESARKAMVPEMAMAAAVWAASPEAPSMAAWPAVDAADIVRQTIPIELWRISDE